MGDPRKTQLVPVGEERDPEEDIPTVSMPGMDEAHSKRVVRRVEEVGLPEETTEPGASTEPVAGRVPVIAPAASFDLPVIGPPSLPPVTPVSLPAVPQVGLPPVPPVGLPSVPPVGPPPIPPISLAPISGR